MKRLAALMLLFWALASAACKTSQSQADPAAGGGEVTETGVKFKSTSGAAAQSPGVLDYVALPFENVLYVPWKILGGGFKGAGDGISEGFAKGRMPAVGVLVSPVNAVVGFVTGAIEKFAASPFLVGPSDSFGNAMSQPTKTATTVWWYE